MNETNFIEIAEYCIKQYKEKFTTNEDCHYVDTLYACITRNNMVLCSKTPHILKEAYNCILIHCRSAKALVHWYNWYSVEYIDEKGCVHENNLDENFKLKISAWGSNDNQIMRLSYEGNNLYLTGLPWEDKLQHVWDLYSIVKNLKTKQEILLAAKLFEQESEISKLTSDINGYKFENELLKRERDQYKDLLDSIKSIVEK